MPFLTRRILSDQLTGSRATRTLLGSPKEWRLWLAPALITSHFVNDPCLHVKFHPCWIRLIQSNCGTNQSSYRLIGYTCCMSRLPSKPLRVFHNNLPLLEGRLGWPVRLITVKCLSCPYTYTSSSFPLSALILIIIIFLSPLSFIKLLFFLFAGVSHYHHGFLNGILSW